MRTRLIAVVLAAGVALTGVMLAPSASGSTRHDVRAARHATKHDRTPAQAKKHGWTTLVRDKNSIACIAMPGMGAMGVHYLNPSRLDGKIQLRKPEALVYRFGNNGHLRLAALEYLVLRSDWEKVHGANAPRPTPVRPPVQPNAGGQPVRPPGVLLPARLDLEAQPRRPLHHVEPAGVLPAGDLRGCWFPRTSGDSVGWQAKHCPPARSFPGTSGETCTP